MERLVHTLVAQASRQVEQITMPENQVPTRREIALRALIAASPRFAGSLSIVFEGVRDRRLARAEEVFEEIATAVGEAHLLLSVQDSEELEILLARVLGAAMTAASRAKREMLRGAAIQAATDTADIDESILIVDALEQIDTPHVRCLLDLAAAQLAAARAGEIGPRAQRTEANLVARIVEAGERWPPVVIGRLAGLGLLEVSGGGSPWPTVLRVSEFGLRLTTEVTQSAASGDGA